MSQSAASWNDAVGAALTGDSQLLPLITRYVNGEGIVGLFSGIVPPDIRLDDYIDLGTDDAVNFGRFHGNGETIRTALHIWCRVTGRTDGSNIFGKSRVLEIAGHVARILNDQRLTLTGYGEAVAIRADLETVFPDPDGDFMHGVMRLSAIARPE